ncbi:hypothetical protein F5J12DRAFT_780352 [Pisolithus orientalis]|uniref:uncharacterized protein n=1 Tax=Pisolithus orientalis TaxID=936130 RepID=UPI0022259F69|nr:uncharacterized protein F5J12DRAFT_780352 [Pisolithus orientalis]KAI6028816.1 hypothetical protein F5J12DRAFT_780352 [Pisolithus orientalis]
MASSLAAWLANGNDVISSDEDVSNSPDVEGKEYCPGDAAPANPAWFPWPNKQVILWGLAILGVDNVPSVKMLKDIDNSLQAQYGIPLVCYQGALGHVYYVNHLPSIITQPWQVTRWLYESDPTVATPMICEGCQDFYVFELAKLMDGTMVIPECWYTKPSALLTSPPFELEYWACACQPNPCNIIETRGHGVLPWTLTDPVVGNIWHTCAKGHHVLSYMIWLYCDDTSSNMSKKWNKHNSFLFTAAGLPHALVHKESNIHFLTTSNIAPPLEMLDGIVAQLDTGQEEGKMHMMLEELTWMVLSKYKCGGVGSGSKAEYQLHFAFLHYYGRAHQYVVGRTVSNDSDLESGGEGATQASAKGSMNEPPAKHVRTDLDWLGKDMKNNKWHEFFNLIITQDQELYGKNIGSILLPLPSMYTESPATVSSAPHALPTPGNHSTSRIAQLSVIRQSSETNTSPQPACSHCLEGLHAEDSNEDLLSKNF